VSAPALAAAHRRIEVRPLTGALGAEIDGVDISKPLDEETRAEIQRAFAEHLLICFRDQPMTIAEHMAFGDNFGPMMDLPRIPKVAGYAMYHEVLREPTTPKAKVAGQNWHSDSTFLPSPPKAVAMRAIEVPTAGGDTAFANLCLMYELMSDRLKDVVGGLNAVHTDRRGITGWARGPVTEADVAAANTEEIHPVVCTHPVTGRKGIFVNRVYTRRFEGMTEEESQPLLGYLYALADRAEVQCRIRWQPNTMVVRDNRFTQHRAIVDYHTRRHLQRTTIAGPRPA
jgi:taurine dioxygenase